MSWIGISHLTGATSDILVVYTWFKLSCQTFPGRTTICLEQQNLDFNILFTPQSPQDDKHKASNCTLQNLYHYIYILYIYTHVQVTRGWCRNDTSLPHKAKKWKQVFSQCIKLTTKYKVWQIFGPISSWTFPPPTYCLMRCCRTLRSRELTKVSVHIQLSYFHHNSVPTQADSDTHLNYIMGQKARYISYSA